MMNYIETKIRIDRMQEDGTTKLVTESYLVDATSFTEAEARITEEMTPYIRGAFSVSAVKKSNISEIFNAENAERLYRCKINIVVLDERTGQEKRTACHILVGAACFDGAIATLKDGMRGSLSDYEIASISESDIKEVYFFTTKQNK